MILAPLSPSGAVGMPPQSDFPERDKMSVNGFPGHMHATRKAILEARQGSSTSWSSCSMRLPGSSANPVLAQLTSGKPTLKVLNKRDLADPVRTMAGALQRPARETRAMRSMPARPRQRRSSRPRRELTPCVVAKVARADRRHPQRRQVDAGQYAQGKRAAQTGDEASVTKVEQRIVLADDFYLYDTPACSGPRSSCPRAVTTSPPAARGRPQRPRRGSGGAGCSRPCSAPMRHMLEARYKLGLDPERSAAMKDDELLFAIGRKRSALLPD